MTEPANDKGEDKDKDQGSKKEPEHVCPGPPICDCYLHIKKPNIDKPTWSEY